MHFQKLSYRLHGEKGNCMTTYKVIDQNGNDHHFLKYKDARAFAFKVSQRTGKGVEVHREPKPFKIHDIKLSV